MMWKYVVLLLLSLLTSSSTSRSDLRKRNRNPEPTSISSKSKLINFKFPLTLLNTSSLHVHTRSKYHDPNLNELRSTPFQTSLSLHIHTGENNGETEAFLVNRAEVSPFPKPTPSFVGLFVHVNSKDQTKHNNIMWGVGSEGRNDEDPSVNYYSHRSHPPNTQHGELEQATTTNIPTLRRKLVRRENRIGMTINKNMPGSNFTDILNHPDLLRGLRKMEDEKDTRMCRLQNYLPEFLFKIHSCAMCYHYIRNVTEMFGQPSRKWNTTWRPFPTRDGRKVYIAFLFDASKSSNNTVSL